jgi:hypothetical protein
MVSRTGVIIFLANFSIFYEFETCWTCLVNKFNQTNENCLGGGRYCCMDPEGVGTVGIECAELLLFIVRARMW